MTHIDLAFRIHAPGPIPSDHAYSLFSAVSRKLPEAHSDKGIAVLPISGRQAGNRQMSLTEDSRLTFRIVDKQVSGFLKLAGKSLQIDNSNLTIGVPDVRAIVPAPTLHSRLVAIKVSGVDAVGLTESVFETAARKQLTALGVAPDVGLTVGTRRTVRIRKRQIVGYELTVSSLSPQESVTLQVEGIGGRRHMGCGVFVARNIVHPHPELARSVDGD